MADYVHIPAPISSADNPLKISLGETIVYDKSVTSTSGNGENDYEPAMFPGVTFEGIEDWELVHFVMMWEQFDSLGSQSNAFNSGICGIRETNTNFRTGVFGFGLSGISDQWPNGDFTNDVYTHPTTGDTFKNVAYGGTASGTARFNSLSAVGWTEGNNVSSFVDGASGWDGWRQGLFGAYSTATANDYAQNPTGGSSGFGLVIPTTQVDSSNNDLFWNQLYFQGPFRYIKYLVNNQLFFRRGLSDSDLLNTSTIAQTPIQFQMAIRTERFDTVYSEKGAIRDLRQGVFTDSSSAAWFYSRGEDLSSNVTVSTATDTIDDVVYPNVALTQVTYPISAKLGTVGDNTDTGFIYRGMKVFMPNNYLYDNNNGDSNNITTITGATQANPVVITSAGHSLINGAHIKITGVEGMTELNNNSYYAKKLTADTFSLHTDLAVTANVDGTGFTAYTSGGEAETNFINTSITNNRTFLSSKIYHTNSAWCTWDYITDPRYGMGNMFSDTKRTNDSYSSVTSNQQYINLYDDLHNAGLRCDEPVRNEAGTADIKRYTMNVNIDGDGSKMETLAQLCSNFDAKPFYHNGFLRIYQDRPKLTQGVFNQTNAMEFSYAGGSDRNRANQIFVKFNNPQKLFSQDAVYTEDRDALKPPAPIVSKDIIGYGITNKGQAIRHGRTLLAREKNNDEVVTFVTGMNATHLKPGDLISLTNSNNDEQRFGGRVSSISGTTLTLDESFEFGSGKQYKAFIQNGNSALPVVETTITHGGTASTTCTLDSTTGLVAHKTNHEGATVNIVETADNFVYEIQRISETDNEYLYEIGCVKYDSDKFTEIDATFVSGFDFSEGFPDNYTEDA